MKVRTFLTVSAVVLGIFGLAMILMPEKMADNFGFEISNLGRVLFRDLGATLLGVAAINWLARDVTDTTGLRAVILGNFVLQVIATIVNVADIAQDYMGSSAWGGVALHAILAVGFAYSYSRLTPTKR
jgi:hypothetical protein